jgi:hypothetical protein
MKISHLFDDPTIRAMLEAAERDQGEAPAIAAREPRAPLTGADAAERELEAA